MTLFLQSPLFASLGVVHGFSVRTGGVSSGPYDSLNLGGAVGDQPAAVDENRRLLCLAAGLNPARLATVHQVHGDRVIFAGPAGLSAGRYSAPLVGSVEADALVVGPGFAAGVRTADCVPILLFNPRSGAAAAIHAGWRGTMSKIVTGAVRSLMDSFGARPVELQASIGPAIGRCCFEVGADLAARFASEESFGPATVGVNEGKNATVDLPLANRRLLEAAGLHPSRVETLERCTSCEPELFFSHRRDAGVTGRHLSFIRGGA